MQPPEHETPDERNARLIAEAEALQRSNAIDEELNRQRQELKKAAKPVRMLLLGALSIIRFVLESPLTTLYIGQSESGM
jgi:hypothetical protein